MHFIYYKLTVVSFQLFVAFGSLVRLLVHWEVENKIKKEKLLTLT